MTLTVNKRMMERMKENGYFILDGVLSSLKQNDLREDDILEVSVQPTLIECSKFVVTRVEEFVNELHHINKKIYVKEI